MASAQVQFEVFRGLLATWNMLFADAAAFATELGPRRLISISHSADQGNGVVTVWYWTDGDGGEEEENDDDEGSFEEPQ